MGFVDRVRELAAIRKRFAGASSLSLLYGQRRTGKSALLREALRARPRSLFFQADESPIAAQAKRFCEEAGELLPAGVSASDWSTVLTLFVQQAALAGGSTYLVLDEAQYLFEADPSLASVIQRITDQHAERAGLHLVLCGSALMAMGRLGDESQPLHGRFDLRLKLEPFGYREAALFVPGYSPADALRVYGVFGGLARHLAAIDGSVSFAENVAAELLDPMSALAEAPLDLLRTERVSSRSEADAVLESLALGENQFNQIAARCGLTAQRLDLVLKELIQLDLVRRVARFGDEGTRGYSRYRTTDPLTAFWFRLVRPARQAVWTLGPAGTFAARIEPRLDDHLGPIFEQVVRQAFEGGHLGLAVEEIAPYWTRDGKTDIDLAIRSGEETWLVECKWRRSQPADLDVLRQLRDHATRAPGGREARLAIVCPTGFTDTLVQVADAEGVRLIDAAELFA